MEPENLLKIHNKDRVSSNINLKSKIFKTYFDKIYEHILYKILAWEPSVFPGYS